MFLMASLQKNILRSDSITPFGLLSKCRMSRSTFSPPGCNRLIAELWSQPGSKPSRECLQSFGGSNSMQRMITRPYVYHTWHFVVSSNWSSQSWPLQAHDACLGRALQCSFSRRHRCESMQSQDELRDSERLRLEYLYIYEVVRLISES